MYIYTYMHIYIYGSVLIFPLHSGVVFIHSGNGYGNEGMKKKCNPRSKWYGNKGMKTRV